MGYRQGTSGAWTDWTDSGAGTTTTVTGLAADTPYQVRVRALNDETPSDWSDPSDAVSTNADDATPTPKVTLRLSDADGEVAEDAGALAVTATVRWATAGGVTPSSSATRMKLRWRAAASKNRRQSRGGRGITNRGAGNRGVGGR